MGALWSGGLVALGFVAGYVASDLRAAPALPPLPPTPQLMADEALAPEPASELPQAEAAAESHDAEPLLASSERAPPPREKPHARVSRARRSGTAVEAEATTSPVTAEAGVSEAPPAAGPREELMLLQRAERAVRADNAALALALISELEARYPRSTLLEERRAIELMAYCVAGASDGRARAQHFIHAHPRSVYAARIAELCPAGAPPAAPDQP